MSRFGIWSGVIVSTMAVAAAVNIATEDTASAAENKAINWTLTGDLKTTDPSKLVDTISQDTVINTGEGLYRVASNGEAKLAAAKSVDVSDDGLTWTFTLRDNLKWSDGSKITADDFVYGWQRTNDPSTASATAPIFYTGIANDTKIQKGEVDKSQLGIKADGDNKLVVTLDHAMPQLKSELAFVGFFPQNKAFVEKAGDKFGTSSKYSISSGPYVLKKWNGSSSTYTYTKNKYYWDAKNVKTNEVNVQTVSSATTSYNLYKSGKVDYTTLSATESQASKTRKDYSTIQSAATQYMMLNTDNKAMKNENIRKAIRYAINREQLTSKVLAGTAKPASTFIPKGLVKDPNTGKDFATGAETGVVKYDMKKAKAYWKKGVAEVGKAAATKDLTLLTDDTDTEKQTATFIQSQLESHLKGINVTVKSVSSKPKQSSLSNHDFDMALQTWAADYADPVEMLNLVNGDNSYNYGQWKNTAYSDIMTKAANEDASNANARFNDLKQAEQMIEKQVGVVPLSYTSNANLKNSHVKNVFLNPVGNTVDFKNASKK